MRVEGGVAFGCGLVVVGGEGGGALGGVALDEQAVGALDGAQERRVEAQCRAASEVLTQTWNEALVARIDAAFAATGVAHASETWARVAPRIEAWTEQWREARAILSEALDAMDGEQHPAAMAEKLAEAGCGKPLNTTADDVLNRLSKKAGKKS